MPEHVSFKAIVDFYEKCDEIRKEKLDEIINRLKDYERVDVNSHCDYSVIIEELEKFKEEEL